jgi:hypothetical protein
VSAEGGGQTRQLTFLVYLENKKDRYHVVIPIIKIIFKYLLLLPEYSRVIRRVEIMQLSLVLLILKLLLKRYRIILKREPDVRDANNVMY